MSGFIEGDNRQQATLFPERLDDYITEKNQVRKHLSVRLAMLLPVLLLKERL